MFHRPLVRAFVLASCSAAGCAGMLVPIEQQPDFGQYFTLTLPGDTEQARLDGPRLRGADLEVSRKADGYRGVGRTGAIDLRASGKKIAGTVGPGSTELFVEEGPGGLHIQGRFADKLSDLTVQPDKVAGTMGRCQYDLRRPGPQAPWYEGQRACGGSLTAVKLALPTALASLQPVDRGVLLAIFLGSEESHRTKSMMGDPGGDPRTARHMPGDMNTERMGPKQMPGM
jgi:hypothetical protein